MSIAFRASSSGDLASGVSPNTITKPSGTVSTDVMLAVYGTDKANNTAHTITPPTGWTRIGAQVSQTNGTTQVVTLDAFWSLGSNANLGFTNSQVGGTVQQGWIVSSFSGVDNTTPIDVADGTGNKNTASATLTVNGVTIVTANAWDCMAAADWLGGVFTATGFTVAENGHTNASAALLYNQTPKSTGATGTATLNSTSGAAQILEAIRFALRPDSAVVETYPAGHSRMRQNPLVRLRRMEPTGPRWTVPSFGACGGGMSRRARVARLKLAQALSN